MQLIDRRPLSFRIYLISEIYINSTIPTASDWATRRHFFSRNITDNGEFRDTSHKGDMELSGGIDVEITLRLIRQPTSSSPLGRCPHIRKPAILQNNTYQNILRESAAFWRSVGNRRSTPRTAFGATAVMSLNHLTIPRREPPRNQPCEAESSPRQSSRHAAYC
jgi:hypothetical protein